MNSYTNQNTGNAMNAAGPLGYVMGTGLIPQLILGLVLATVLYIVLMSFEMIYKSMKAVTGTRVTLLDATVNAENKPLVFEQNPLNPKNKLLPLSDNERTGAEFSYSFYMWVNPSSFKQYDGLLHIMHKGNPKPYPLMSPGVFMKSNTNTMRVYMNSSKTWNNFVDIENIPVKKWVHIVILGRNNTVEVYVNGNISKKMNMDGGVFYQNFGNLYLFRSDPSAPVTPTSSPSVGSTPFQTHGTISGNLSSLIYFNYALSYTEIRDLTAVGPSKKVESGNDTDAPPYLEDSWWVSSYSR
jgi:hypothetical protein